MKLVKQGFYLGGKNSQIANQQGVGDCHDEQVRAIEVVSGAGNDYRRSFCISRLIDERKGYEDDIAKSVCATRGSVFATQHPKF